MKKRLLSYLVCPHCAGEFRLEVVNEERLQYSDAQTESASKSLQARGIAKGSAEYSQFWEGLTNNVTEGTLYCDSCKSEYPIVSGIPRILDQALRTEAAKMGRGNPVEDYRLNFFDDTLAPVDKSDSKFMEVQLANQSNYGYEWQAFAHDYEEWETVYRKGYVREDLSFFNGKIGLDAGCGMARYSLVPVKYGAEVFGVDLSNAIESAYAKSLKVPMFHAVQGDIFNLPFKAGTFDFAQSLGVVHITPNPQEAVKSIKSKVKEGGKLYLYVYKSFEDSNLLKHFLLKPVTALRSITVKMPSNYLYYFLYLLVPFVLTFCYFPSWFLQKVLKLDKFANLLPYSYEEYSHRRIRDIHMNLFDRFGNPVERRYNYKQMKEWMDSIPFKSCNLYEHYGWNVEAVI